MPVDGMGHPQFVFLTMKRIIMLRLTDAVLDEGDLGDGEAYITRMDGTIISGTFSGGSIKEGRFDIKYREKPEGGEAVY